MNLVSRSQEMGTYLGSKLQELKPKHPSIGEVRGLGMFWAVELVKDQKTKEPFNTGVDKVSGKPLVVDKVAARMMGNGVYVQAWLSHFVVAPPIIINKDEIDSAVAVFDEALTIADKELAN